VRKLSSWLPWRRKGADNSLELFAQVFGQALAKAGVTVTWDTAIKVSTVLACARVIANGIAQVPLKLFRESADGRERLPARDHPLWYLLHSRPNPWQTSFEFRETMALHLVLTGRHYSFINRLRGAIVELIPFEPGQVEAKRADDGEISYKVTFPNGRTQTFPAESIWHVRGPSWNGWQGMDAVRMAREAIGLSIAAEEQHANLFANGVSPSGVYSVDGTLNPEQYKALRAFIKENYTGANSGLPMLLDRGAKWLPMAMSGVDSQHLETRRFQVEEICRSAGVLPIMVGHADKTITYASAEQMFLAHVVHTLTPWYVRLEQSIEAHILTPHDVAAGVYVKFIIAALLRGALKDQGDFLFKMTAAGILTRNEARELLERNPIEGLDEPLTPANMTIGTDRAEPPEGTQP
jgi:HK97 family phage portal protein